MAKQTAREILRDALDNALFITETPDDTDRFVEDLGLDSMDLTELIIEIEDLTGLSIPEGELLPVRTFGDAVELLEGKL